ncbi:MAG: ABC transporter ATP-binding protein [Bauldia sp.]
MTMFDLAGISFSYGRGRPVLTDVSFAVGAGDSLGIVGESGSGKTTLLRMMLALVRPQAGTVAFDGTPLAAFDRRSLRAFRRRVQPVFQDPYSSLDPRQTVGAIVAEPLRALRIPGDAREASARALAAVGLGPEMLRRYPHAFSGGQRQRIAIARAIVPAPDFLLADEPVSALDLSTRGRIVDLLAELSARMTLVLVSHDIAVVASLCRRIVVLERGRIVEAGPTRDVLRAPRHPYTQRLLASIPRLTF